MPYEPLPLPDHIALSPGQSLSEAEAFRARMATRHSVRDFADTPIDEAVIRTAIATAGGAPSGANQQPWFFAAIRSPEMKTKIREAAEVEERDFYAGGGGDEWLKALEPIGTGASKPHLEICPWLIVIFAQRWGVTETDEKRKHYYVPESVGIATGFLIAALHHAGLSTLTHTPNPMKFLNALCGRPDNDKPVMILAVGHAADTAVVPAVAKVKKPLDQIMSIL